MASTKIATLIIRTIAKPISAQLKEQAKKHDRFRTICVSLAQGMYRAETKLRTNILGEPAKHVRPLSETRAIEQGANALAEGFLFAVAAGLIIGEAYRSSRSTSKRRDDVDDQLEELGEKFKELNGRIEAWNTTWEDRLSEEKQRNDELSRILERVVEIGLRGGWAEFEDTPLRIPRIELAPASHRIEELGSDSPYAPKSNDDVAQIQDDEQDRSISVLEEKPRRETKPKPKP